MRVSYHEAYVAPLPEGHVFPMSKFAHLRRLVEERGWMTPKKIIAPRMADWADLLLVHSEDYLSRFENGTLTRQEVRRLGLPWSEPLVRRSRHAVQGTINACFMALEDGVSGNLAGGTHHAMPGHGEGFCVFNDVAVALKVLLRAGWITRALVVDLDVHQGNGTAHIFADDPRVYTFSMHGAKNFPFHKPPSSRDVPLDDRLEDAPYLALLHHHLPAVMAEAQPDLVLYLAGVDVVADDRFGRLSLTLDGLRARDRYVVETVRDTGIPLVLLLSGGYAPTHEETARRHSVVFEEALRAFGHSR